jgi:hypothetical protein
VAALCLALSITSVDATGHGPVGNVRVALIAARHTLSDAWCGVGVMAKKPSPKLIGVQGRSPCQGV